MAARASTTWSNARPPPTRSTTPCGWSIAAASVCLAAFPHEAVPVDIAHIVRNNIYLYGIRGEGKSATHRAEAFMRQKRFDATKIHTHTFALDDLPDGDALRQGPGRGRDQGGGESARRSGGADARRRSSKLNPLPVWERGRFRAKRGRRVRGLRSALSAHRGLAPHPARVLANRSHTRHPLPQGERVEPSKGWNGVRANTMLLCDEYLTPVSLEEAFAAMERHRGRFV